MRIKLIIFFSLVLFMGCIHKDENRVQKIQGEMSWETMDEISESVYEILISKPKNDRLKYESNLPYEKLPFSYRNDSYFSIGTAFAISKNRFVSAAHVLELDKKTQSRELFIRSKDGKVYAINNIYKYSVNRDFVIFDIKEDIDVKPLKISKELNINETVYAVGNALGDGIITRDGRFTSLTYEENDGKWKWIRFSAPASPGNSGGPLINNRGEVIGVILRKSESENLNYALPITEVLDFKENSAHIFKKLVYMMINFDKKSDEIFDYRVKLPLNYIKLREKITTNFTLFSDEIFDNFLEKYKGDLFPNSEDSLELLYREQKSYFPYLIAKVKDGKWNTFAPKNIKKNDISKDAYVKSGTVAGFSFIYLKKPKDISLNRLYNNPRVMMDLVLKGTPVHRRVWNENVRITSFGDPVTEKILTDRYNRHWIESTWKLEYNDSMAVTFALPVPDGMIVIGATGSTDDLDINLLPDGRELLNYIFLSYKGNFGEWSEFLKEDEFLADVLKDIKFEYKEDEFAKFESERLKIKYDKNLFTITENSFLTLQMGYFNSKKKVIWDVIRLGIGEDTNRDNYFYVKKNLKPISKLNRNYHSEWEKIYEHIYPYDNRAFSYDGRTLMNDLSKMNDKASGEEEFLYTISLSFEGTVEESLMKEKMNLVQEAMLFIEKIEKIEEQN